jgi:tetratricopeptide (TPR) repeat protein
LQPSGPVEFQLMHAASLLDRDPSAAARAAALILRDNPQNQTALLLLGKAHRASGDLEAAVTQLNQLGAAQPDSAVIALELGRALRLTGQLAGAREALERAIMLSPDLSDAWRELALVRDAQGDFVGCDAAYARFAELAPENTRLAEPITALASQRYEAAEQLLKRILATAPEDVAALRMLAKASSARENYREAERLLIHSLQLAPGYTRARQDLVEIFLLQMRGEPMLAPIERLLATDPANESYRTLLAAAHNLLGHTERAIEILEALTQEFPHSEVVWLNFGHTLRAAGRSRDAAAAYRKCIELAPPFASAWVALANLKTSRFTPEDVAAMRQQLADPQLLDDERSQFEFCLGKALEDAGEFADSFAHYARGNALRRAIVYYEAADTARFVERTCKLYTREFFAARKDWGCLAEDPIFIVGLPRAGSTLLEQILASHSQIEGTRELAEVTRQAIELGDLSAQADAMPRYPGSVAQLSRSQLTAFGEHYLSQTRAQRLLGRPRFVDKMGDNFLHLGLIHLMLPRARIIDARRSPVACCFANFKQHFHRGAWFSYSLEDLGRYYRDYVALMAHFDTVLPGRVCRVNYENVVRDLEGEVRRLLAHCGLPFEEQCLDFHQTRRAVQTVSSEQVRQPIYSDAVEHWRRFEPWLGPLKESLGDLADPASG